MCVCGGGVLGGVSRKVVLSTFELALQNVRLVTSEFELGAGTWGGGAWEGCEGAAESLQSPRRGLD